MPISAHQGGLTISVPTEAEQRHWIKSCLCAGTCGPAGAQKGHQLASVSPSEVGQSWQQNPAVLMSRPASFYCASEIVQGDFENPSAQALPRASEMGASWQGWHWDLVKVQVISLGSQGLCAAAQISGLLPSWLHPQAAEDLETVFLKPQVNLLPAIVSTPLACLADSVFIDGPKAKPK